MKLNVGVDPTQGLTQKSKAQVEADLERTRSNAAVPRPARKLRRQGSRGSSKAAAIRDSRD